MSIRAHRVKKIVTELEPSFSLWHHPEFNGVVDGLNSDGTGLATVNAQELLDAAEQIKDKAERAEVLASIRHDIDEHIVDNELPYYTQPENIWLEYYCF